VSKYVDGRVIWRDFGLKKILRNVQDAAVEHIRVGVVGPKAHDRSMDDRLTNAEVAAINHYGSSDGHVPARRFLTEPFQHDRFRVMNIMRKAVERLVFEKVESAMDRAGEQLAEVVRRAIIATPGIGPANAPSTVAKKGFNHPLVWGYGLAEAISHRLVRGRGDFLEAGASAGEYEHFEVAGGE
jgi:hypothetical protein